MEKELKSRAIVEDLKEKVTLHDVVSLYRPVRKASGWYTALCVSHQEKTPSLKWKPGDKVASCFGCEWKGDIFAVVMAVEGCEFPAAVRKVQEIERDSWEKGRRPVEKAFGNQFSQEESELMPLEDWRGLHAALLESPEAVAFLEGRGISTEQAKASLLGYMDGRFFVGTDDEHRDCPFIGIPYIDKNRVSCVKWRDVRHKQYRHSVGKRARMYFGENLGLSEFEDLFVVSGEFDAIILRQSGRQAVSLHSDSSPPTAQERDVLVRSGCRLIYAGDTDRSGVRAMNKLGIELGMGKVLTWPGAKDANEFYLKDPEGFSDNLEKLLEEGLQDPTVPGFEQLCASIASLSDTPVMDDPLRFRWPWANVDKMAAILPGHVITVCATYTGTGKSTFLLNGMIHNACHGDGKVPAIYSAEQSPSELARMAVAYITRSHRLYLTRENMQEAMDRLESVNLYVGYDTSKTKIKEVLDLCEDAVRHLGITDLVIDNLGFIARSEHKNIYQVQASAMQRIKNLARELSFRIWVVTASRKPGTGRERYQEGELSDILGTQAFEADADHVIWLHRAIKKNVTESDSTTLETETWVKFKKSRHVGEAGAVQKLTMVGEQAAFYEVAVAGQGQESRGDV